MFIKWREENKPIPPERLAELRALRPFGMKNPHHMPVHRMYAYLAESRRVEGKPRQRVVVYLGSIPAATMQENSAEWRAFWYKVNCSLLLAQVDYRMYRNALQGVGERVMRPSDDNLIRIVADAFECHPQWHKDYEKLCRVIGRTDDYLGIR